MIADIVVFDCAIRSASIASVVVAIVTILSVFAEPIAALGHAHGTGQIVVEDARSAHCAGGALLALGRAGRAVVLLTAEIAIGAGCGVSALGFVFKEPNLSGRGAACTLAASERVSAGSAVSDARRARAIRHRVCRYRAGGDAGVVVEEVAIEAGSAAKAAAAHSAVANARKALA